MDALAVFFYLCVELFDFVLFLVFFDWLVWMNLISCFLRDCLMGWLRNLKRQSGVHFWWDTAFWSFGTTSGVLLILHYEWIVTVRFLFFYVEVRTIVVNRRLHLMVDDYGIFNSHWPFFLSGSLTFFKLWQLQKFVGRLFWTGLLVVERVSPLHCWSIGLVRKVGWFYTLPKAKNGLMVVSSISIQILVYGILPFKLRKFYRYSNIENRCFNRYIATKFLT